MPKLLLPGAVRGAGVDPGGDVAQQTDPLLREDDQGDHRPPSRHSRNIIYIPPLNICPSQLTVSPGVDTGRGTRPLIGRSRCLHILP